MLLRIKPGFECPVYDEVLGIDAELMGTEAELREFCGRVLQWLDAHPGGVSIIGIHPPCRHLKPTGGRMNRPL